MLSSRLEARWWLDSVDVFYLTPPPLSFSCFLTRGGTLSLWSGTSAQIRQSERPPEVVRQEGAEPSLGESGLWWSFSLGICTAQSSVSAWQLTGQQQPELNWILISTQFPWERLSWLLPSPGNFPICIHFTPLSKYTETFGRFDIFTLSFMGSVG